MRRFLFLSVVFLLWNHPSVGATSTCNTIWRSKDGVYIEGSTLAEGNIPNEKECRNTCSRAHTNCQACEFRKTNCWLHLRDVTTRPLVKYAGSKQWFLVQRCDPEFYSAQWLEATPNYPNGPELSDFDKGRRYECLNACASESPPCTGVIYWPATTVDIYEPYGSNCTHVSTGNNPDPNGGIEYKLISKN